MVSWYGAGVRRAACLLLSGDGRRTPTSLRLVLFQRSDPRRAPAHDLAAYPRRPPRARTHAHLFLLFPARRLPAAAFSHGSLFRHESWS